MPSKVQTEIDSIDKSIGTLVSRIQNLKKELESGNWGTQQLSDLEVKLNKLNRSLSGKTTKRESLVSKQETKELESLNKSIDTLNKKIANRNAAISGPRTEAETVYTRMEKEVKNAEKALASLESRRAKRFDPISGKRLTEEQIGQRQQPILEMPRDDIEKRLNKSFLGINATNSEIALQVAKARQIALDIIKGRISTGGATGGFQEGDIPYKPPVGSDAATQEALKQLNAGKSSTKSSEAKAKADAKRARQAEETTAKEKELNDLRNRIANDPAYRNYLNQLQQRGLGVEDVKSAENRGSSLTKVNASRMQGGTANKYSAMVNEKTGTSTPGISSMFRSFGSDILRDIGQFTKWSIAVAAVYTPMKKLGELITIMIDNESRLADAAIAANIPFEKSGEIFDVVAVSANQAGESINTTIDAYAQAIRAAGRYNTEQEKSQKAIALLNDSLILSKLSTLDQATSIDTLSAALLQSDKELDQGQELLNKWVRISQVANVSIDGLATGVAVLGDSAETVGLSIDQLNGLIAVLSEQSISGSKEAANTAKALVGAYQSDKAEAALNKYGIALRKANGEVRGFLEIYQELSNLRQQGILSEAAVSEVALALGGGGVRRAKDASALINSTERLNDLAEESAKITGEDTLANDSLAKKLETVQTANTRLANSFQELAQTLGDDGGLLDAFKDMINGLTTITKGVDELFTLLGRSGPILATYTTGLIAIQALSAGTRETLLMGLSRGPKFGAGGLPLGAAGASYGGGIGGLARGSLANILQMNLKGGALLGGAGVALQAGSNLKAGNTQNAEANVIGGVIGGAIGAYLGGGPGLAIGANVGSAVGDAFLNALYEHSEDLANYFFPKDYKAPTEKDKSTSQTKLDEMSTSELLDMATKSLGIGGNLKAFFAASVGPGFSGYGGKKESAGLDILQTTNPALYREIKQREAQQKADEAKREAEAAIRGGSGGTKYEGFRKQLEEQASVARQQQLQSLATGQITSAEYGRVANQISGFPAASIKSVTAFGEELGKVSDALDTTTEAYDAFLYIATYGTQEQINAISQYSDNILILKGYIDNWKPELIGVELQLSWGTVKIESLEQLQELLTPEQVKGSLALDTTLKQVQLAQGQAVKLPPLVGDYNKPLTGEGQDAAIKHGLEIMDKFLVETGKSAEEIVKFKAAIETFYSAVDRGAGVIFEGTNVITQQFYDLGKSAAEAAGELGQLQGFGFSQYKDVTTAEFLRLQEQANTLGASWENKYPGFESKPEDFLAITKDGMTMAHADTKILALLLEQLNDKAQKQLDGQYNIPEGATFWVPLTAAYYRNKGGDAGGGMNDMLAGLDFQENTTATDRNTNAIDYLTNNLALLNEQRRGAAPQATRDAYLRDNNLAIQNEKRRAEVPEAALVKNNLALLNEQRRAVLPFTSTIRPPDNLKHGPMPPGIGSGQSTNVNTNPTTKLDLKLSSNINLVVDGRVLANAMQSYLASELLRTEQSQGTISRRYII